MLKLLHILPGAFESDRWQVGRPFFLFFTVPCNFVIALQGLYLENILGWHFYCWRLRCPTPLFCHWSRYREQLITSSSPAFHSPETNLFPLCRSRERANTKVSAGGENKCCGKEDVFIGDAEEQRIPEKQLAGHKGICSLAFYLPNKSFQVKSLMRGQEKRKMIRYLIP